MFFSRFFNDNGHVSVNNDDDKYFVARFTNNKVALYILAVETRPTSIRSCMQLGN